jgi:DNA polymerase III sliding clamp (beta) subunit (PCNA family)
VSEAVVSPFAGTEPPGGVDYGEFSLTIKRFVLADATDWAASAVTTQAGSLPVLSCFQVRVTEAGLRVAATDLQRTVIVVSGALDTKAPEGSQVYLPSGRVLKMLTESPEGDVTISVKKSQATVTAANGAFWDLNLVPPDGFPVLPDPDEAVFTPYSRASLLDGLKNVRHAVCRDASRVNLTQVALTPGQGEGVITAADGNRMARAALEGYPLAMFIPAPVLPDLVRLLGRPVDDIGVAETAKALLFRSGEVTVAVNKRFNEWPDLDKLMVSPTVGYDQVLGVDKEKLLGAIRRVRINADASTSAIALSLSDGSMTVFSRDTDGNSAEEAVTASWEGGDRLLVVNHAYLTDMLTAHPKEWCEFKVGKDVGKKRSMVRLADGGTVQVMMQLPPKLVGY